MRGCTQLPEVIKQLGARPLDNGWAIEPALDSEPKLLPNLLRQGSRNGQYGDTAAIVLILIDREWCWAELSNLLRQSDDWRNTTAARLVLRDCPDPSMRELASRWEAAHSNKPEAEQLWEESIVSDISRLTGVVDTVRDQVPDP